MKIAIVGGHAPALIGFRGPLLRALATRGHDVVAIADPAPPELVAEIEALGVRFRPIPVERNAVSLAGDLELTRALVRLLREERPDLFFGYMHKPIIYGTFAAVLAGVKRRVSMVTGLGYPWEADTSRHLRFRRLLSVLYRMAFRFNEAVIFHNRDDRAVMVDDGLLPSSKAVVVNGSGIDLGLYPERPQPTRPPLRFLMVSRLVGSKGIYEYVEAARLVRQQHSDVVFDLVGPTDPHPEAVKLHEVEAWQREGVIRYHGPQKDVRPFLEACSVYVLPSHAEGTPRSVLEAMSVGRAIITTDTRGCRETVIDGVNGFLAPLKDAAGFAAAMVRFIEEPALCARMGAESRCYVQEKFEVGSVNAAMFKIFGI